MRHERAGSAAQPGDVADTESLIADYYSIRCDPGEPAQRVVFGTNGHRGSASAGTFNDDHVAAISQAIVDHRTANHVAGPLFMGRDTHALSGPAQDTAMEVFAANGVTLVLDAADGYVPTPAVSHAILRHNREHAASAADGVVITPSHNPPTDGGYKYNDAHGGPADAGATSWIQERANRLLADRLTGVRRIPSARALTAASTVRYDYLGHYVADLSEVVDLEPVRAAGLRIGADPLGGASVAYWDRIAETYGLDLAVVNPVVDPTWRFMALDWDGRIRMDCSSADTMAPLIARRGDYDISVANDADADRHGIVTPDAGLLPPNHFLAAAIAYLHGHRKAWPPTAGIGKSMVTSGMIDRIAAHVRRPLVEVPVGFKWFGEGLRTGRLCWGGEESAGASFARRDGSVWTTDKDGIAPALLAAEMTAVTGRTPCEHYRDLTGRFGEPAYARVDAPATAEQKARLSRLAPASVRSGTLAGQDVTAVLTAAPGTGTAFGGIKVTAADAWFAARPSGTEDVYKIYAESFLGPEHLDRVLREAESTVGAALDS